MKSRKANVDRKTNETDISCTLNLDGTGEIKIDTGIGFYDHMLHSLAHHARFDLELICSGDLEVDDHHTVEDCALVLGAALDQALGERKGIARFGWAITPMDDALARAATDLSGRGFSAVQLNLEREKLGTLSCENLPHALHVFATHARINLHVEVLYGANDHHKAEAAFKAVALALRQAVALDGTEEAASTKGILV